MSMLRHKTLEVGTSALNHHECDTSEYGEGRNIIH